MKFINILKSSSESKENVNDSFKSELCSYNTGSDINFCDSSFIINKMRLRTTKKRNGPSVKRLDITLSKIKTTVKNLNAKQTRVKFNLNSNGLNLMEQECDLHEKNSLFVKNRNIVKQKSGSTIMKRIVKQNQYESCSRMVSQQVQPVIIKSILNTNKVKNSNQVRKNQPSMGLRAYKLKVQNKDEMDICQIQVSKQDQIPFLENHVVIDQVVSSTQMRFDNEKEICNVIGIQTSEIIKQTTIKSTSSISKFKKLRSLNTNDFFKTDNFKFEINI